MHIPKYITEEGAAELRKTLDYSLIAFEVAKGLGWSVNTEELKQLDFREMKLIKPDPESKTIDLNDTIYGKYLKGNGQLARPFKLVPELYVKDKETEISISSPFGEAVYQALPGQIVNFNKDGIICEFLILAMIKSEEYKNHFVSKHK